MPVFAVLLIFVAGLLLSMYLMFVRSMIQYQGDQALYCVNEAKPPAVCRHQLSSKLKQFLPWGKIGRIDLRFNGDKGTLDIKWIIQGFTIHIAKQMSVRQILRKKGLH